MIIFLEQPQSIFQPTAMASSITGSQAVGLIDQDHCLCPVDDRRPKQRELCRESAKAKAVLKKISPFARNT
jgi:hypothetical protein